MRVDSQVKMLRALQEHSITRVGATSRYRWTPGSSRIQRGPGGCGAARRTSEGLFFRLNEFPSAFHRCESGTEDILFLAERFLDVTNRELGKSYPGAVGTGDEAAADVCWPATCDSSRGAIRRAVLVADTLIDVEHLRLPVVHCLSEHCQPRPWASTCGDCPLREVIRAPATPPSSGPRPAGPGASEGKQSHAARFADASTTRPCTANCKKYGLQPTTRRRGHDKAEN